MLMFSIQNGPTVTRPEDPQTTQSQAQQTQGQGGWFWNCLPYPDGTIRGSVISPVVDRGNPRDRIEIEVGPAKQGMRVA